MVSSALGDNEAVSKTNSDISVEGGAGGEDTGPGLLLC